MLPVVLYISIMSTEAQKDLAKLDSDIAFLKERLKELEQIRKDHPAHDEIKKEQQIQRLSCLILPTTLVIPCGYWNI